jgi:hypothetical protein
MVMVMVIVMVMMKMTMVLLVLVMVVMLMVMVHDDSDEIDKYDDDHDDNDGGGGGGGDNNEVGAHNNDGIPIVERERRENVQVACRCGQQSTSEIAPRDRRDFRQHVHAAKCCVCVYVCVCVRVCAFVCHLCGPSKSGVWRAEAKLNSHTQAHLDGVIQNSAIHIFNSFEK